MDWILYITIFIVGLIVGSFLNLCIYQIPRGIKLLSPLSQIFNCKINNNKNRIKYILVSLLTGILFLLVYIKVGKSIYLIPSLTLTSILIIVTFIDIDTKTIPNGLMLFGLIVATVFVASSIVPNILGTYIEKVLDSIYGALIGFVPLFIINVISKVLLKREGMGGGDMKLMAVTGLFLGATHTIVAMLLSIYIGGLAGAIILLSSRKKDTPSGGHYMAFGPFLALGSLISMLYGTDIIRWYINLIG